MGKWKSIIRSKTANAGGLGLVSRDLLESSSGKSNAKSLQLEDATCWPVNLNLIGLIKRCHCQPLCQVGEGKMLQLDPQGTAWSSMSIDKQMHAVVRVPMKLFREFSRLQNN